MINSMSLFSSFIPRVVGQRILMLCDFTASSCS